MSHSNTALSLSCRRPLRLSDSALSSASESSGAAAGAALIYARVVTGRKRKDAGLIKVIQQYWTEKNGCEFTVH